MPDTRMLKPLSLWISAMKRLFDKGNVTYLYLQELVLYLLSEAVPMHVLHL